MASQQATIDELLERLAGLGRVTAKKMFGEYCIYLNGKPVALVCDDILYVKPTAAGREVFSGAEEDSPYPGAKPHIVVPEDRWADEEKLCRLLQTTFDVLPQAKKAKRRR